MVRRITGILLLALCGCGNVQPIAKATTPEIAAVGDTVMLDASATLLDRDATYLWTLDSAPSGSTATIANPRAARTSFVPDLPGRYSFTVTVSNEDFSDATSIVVTVIPAVADGVTEVGVLVIHSVDTLLGWQIGRTLDEAVDLVALEYPNLVADWNDGTVIASLINVPIADTPHPELYRVVDWTVELIPAP
ncbi:hypothetical protein JCM30471_24650 [Desulfuromonas carbonis]|uniref:PKD domain-containing protein n=1 Tax=Desulfuromonas sp. DDH964 TaxID=1823759 RepID=UPI00078E8323|nr:PKD domain-containing protein [Desulfuromonas sp. DDH964]AMV70470.1 hypothetical protein DBW_0069 [Desulfuromonas sp. DDH964]